LRGAAEGLVPTVGTAAACRALGLCWAAWYRRQHPRPSCGLRPTPARALGAMQRQTVLAMLHAERFVDQSPAEVYAVLLDEGTYLCSIRTMYRLLTGAGEVRERRNQLRHPRYVAPVLKATARETVRAPTRAGSRGDAEDRGPAHSCRHSSVSTVEARRRGSPRM
jgi:putative transposase